MTCTHGHVVSSADVGGAAGLARRPVIITPSFELNSLWDVADTSVLWPATVSKERGHGITKQVSGNQCDSWPVSQSIHVWPENVDLLPPF